MFYIGILTMIAGATVSFWGICFGAVDHGNLIQEAIDLGNVLAGAGLIMGGLTLCEASAERSKK